MNQQLERSILMTRFHAFQTLLHERGIPLELPSDEDLQKLSLTDIADLTRQLRDIARTPIQG